MKKNDLIKTEDGIYRILSIEANRVLAIDCIKKTMLYGMRDCVAALVKDNGLYTGGNGDFAYFSYN